jgi:hypothetical protein
MTDAAEHLNRLVTLLGKCESISPIHFDGLLATIRGIDPDNIKEKGKKSILQDLRSFISRHRGHSSQPWALPDEQLRLIEEVMAALEPTDPIFLHVWLFKLWVELPDGGEDDYHQKEAKVRALRIAALQGISSGGLIDVLRLAAEAEHPHLVGLTLGQVDTWDRAHDEAVVQLIRDPEESTQLMVGGFIRERFAQGGSGWLLHICTQLRSLLSDEALAFIALNSDTRPDAWDVVESFGADVSASYWSKLSGIYVRNDHAVEGARRFIEHGRAITAVTVLGDAAARDGSAIDPHEALRFLQTACGKTVASDSVTDHFPWSLGQLLDYVFRQLPHEIEAIATVEWALSPSLSAMGADREPRALYKHLEESPRFFLELISCIKEKSTSDDDHEKVQFRSHRAYELVTGWKGIPGALPGAAIDEDKFNSWMTEARTLLLGADVLSDGDNFLGRMLSNSPSDGNGCWPCTTVRKFIEHAQSLDLGRGLYFGRINGRGMVSRDLYSGGDEDRALAGTATQWADHMEDEHPITAGILRQLSQSYLSRAESQDREAQSRLDYFGG